MINYQIAAGFTLPQPNNLSRIVLTPEGKAMGGVPGWNTMIDPAYLVSGSPLNRASGQLALVDGEATVGSFSNGEPAFTYSGASYEIKPQNAISGSEWTLFSVLDLSLTSGSFNLIIPTITVDGVSQIGLRAAVIGSTGNLFVYPGSGNNDPRLSTEGGLFNNRLTLVMITFSITAGLAIWSDGNLIATAPTDKRPLTAGISSDQWSLFRRNQVDSGRVGMTGILNTDMSLPENAGYRRAIERFLMTKYGIS